MTTTQVQAMKRAAGLAGGKPWPASIYYATWPGQPDGLVKIGYARNVRKRLAQLTWDGPAPVLVVAEPAALGAYAAERARHEQFGHLRQEPLTGPAQGRTETFRVEDDLAAFMASLREQHPGWRSQTSIDMPVYRGKWWRHAEV